MKRTLSLAMCLLAVLLMLAANGTTQPRVSAAPPLQATATPEDVEVDAGDPTPEATIPTAGSGKPGGTIKGTPVPTNPLLKPPKTLDELRMTYPDLGPFIDKYKDATVADIPMAELYTRIVEIYEADGATGVATFLEESGMMDKLNIPLSYLDLLRAFDTGGPEAVQALAKKRQLINSKEELVGYLALDLLDNAQSETERLIALGVSVYRLIEETEEIEIGIPLAILAQLQTPGKLLEYLIQVANGPHILGYRLPSPGFTSGLKLQEAKGVGAQTIGADKWHEAGITGEGVKVGILDPGFGGFAGLLGSELPENVTTIRDADEMDSANSGHGTAVAAVVHKVAPGAELFLADYDPSSFDTFIDALDWLKSQEVKVINFSVTYPFGPRDGTFADAVIVDKYIADTGVVWVNSAGNYALSHTMVKYKAGEKGLHDFGAEEPVFTMPFVAGAPVTTIIMNWNGSWKGSEKSQYDFIILDEEGNELATGNQPKRGKKNDYPVQIQSFESEPGTVYYMAIRRTKGKTDNVLDIFVRDSILADWAQVPGYSVTMPGDANSVMTVGATGLSEDQLEAYSSQGPTLDDRLKPDITAPTGEVVAAYGDGFYGTSGAAPMITGAAALVLQAFPDLTEAEVRAWLAEHIVDLGDNGADPQFGSGRLALPEPSGEGGETEGENSGEEELIVISDVKVKFNVKVGKDKGVQIKTSFELDNFEGKQLVVAAIIMDANGKAVPSANKKYDVNGTIGTGVVVKPKRNQTVFKNVTLFIPNSAFSKAKNKEVFLVVGAIDATEQDNAKLIARSEPVKIKIK